MSVLSEFKSLPDNTLRAGERDRLLMRVNDLLATLGAPGNWGYDTKLGELTRILLEQKIALLNVG